MGPLFEAAGLKCGMKVGAAAACSAPFSQPSPMRVLGRPAGSATSPHMRAPHDVWTAVDNRLPRGLRESGMPAVRNHQPPCPAPASLCR